MNNRIKSKLQQQHAHLKRHELHREVKKSTTQALMNALKRWSEAGSNVKYWLDKLVDLKVPEAKEQAKVKAKE